MAKSTNESVTKVEAAALSSKTKPSKKSKRDVGVDLDIEKDPKKQKKEVIQPGEVAPSPKKKKKKKKNKKKKMMKKKDTDVEATQKSNEKQKKKKKKDTDVEAAQKSNEKLPTTLFAGHLPFHTAKSDLQNFFKEVGEIVDVRVGKGIAHIEFASEEAAQKAMELNGKPLLGRNILLDVAKKKPQPNLVKTIFVTGFNKSVSEDDMKAALRGHFSACGEIKRISLPYYQETGDSKGVAYLDLIEDGFNKALELNGSALGGRTIVVTEARPKIKKDADGDSDLSSARPGRGNGDSSKKDLEKAMVTVEHQANQV